MSRYTVHTNLCDSTECKPCSLQHFWISVSEEVDEATQQLGYIITVVCPGVGTECQQQGYCCLCYSKVAAPGDKSRCAGNTSENALDRQDVGMEYDNVLNAINSKGFCTIYVLMKA